MSLRMSRAAICILALVAIAVFIDSMGRPLANPDEGRYSEISREMAATGDWITPRLNGVKYFEKPPLQYWATALSFKAFGENEYSARLYVVACGLLTLLVVGYTGWRVRSPATGAAATLALASSPYFMALGTIVTLDMGLTLWTTATLCAFLLSETAAGKARRAWMLAAWAAMALAVLSKGLVGIVFPGAALFLHCVLRRDFSVLRRLEWGWGLAILLAIDAPWFVAVSRDNPEFARFFFVHEHFERFLTKTHRRVEPWWYFFPIMAIGFLPWMFALPAALAHGWKSEAGKPGAQPLRLAILWAAFLVLFFSASGSKLPAYVLPAFPPLGLVLGAYLAEAPLRRLSLWAGLCVPVGFALLVFALQSADGPRDEWSRSMYQAAQGWMIVAAAVQICASLAATLLLRHGRRWIAILVVALGALVTIDCIEDGYEEFSPRVSGLEVAGKMKPLLTPTTRIYSVDHYDQSLPFYIGRTVTLVNYRDEFETGLEAEPGLALWNIEEFEDEWLRPGDALAIMQPGTFDKFQRLGLPMQVIHQDPRRVLVRKP
jgi:4-amino-4-deoxy-L-arabinose transferase-like glycosyltransferase